MIRTPLDPFPTRTSSANLNMKFLLLVGVCALPALALPEPVSGGVTLAARDNVKLNQYRTMDDW